MGDKINVNDETEIKFINRALELVREAGNVVRTAFAIPPHMATVLTKSSDIDLVTESDRKVEDLLTRGLLSTFPDHKFIGEESTAEGKKIEWTNAPTWIIDPIDGTTNFVHRCPMLAICVGLAINKQLRAGIVYNPITDELYTARTGHGAFKNGFPIQVSRTQTLSRAIINVSLGVHNHVEGAQEIYFENARAMIAKGVRGTRSLGSAAIHMVYVAEGRIDSYLEFGLHCWDVAAAAVIILEAGGIVRDPSGGPFQLMSRAVLTTATLPLADEISKSIKCVAFEHEG